MLTAKRFPDKQHALAQAVVLLHATEPFASWRFQRLAQTLMGQIKRDHYLFVFDDGKIVGYAGWMRCSQEVADRFLHGDYTPTEAECEQGDCCYALCWYAASPEINRYQARICRKLNADTRIYIPRMYPDGRSRAGVVFNKVKPDDASAGASS